MKFGAHSQMFVHDIAEGPSRVMATIAELGMDAVEINVGPPENFPVPAVAEALRASGLDAVLGVALPADRSTISDDPILRRAGVDHLKRCIEIAHELGARKVCGGLHSANGTFVGRPRTAGEWERSVSALAEVAPLAVAADVLLTVEPVSRYSGFFLNSADDALALVGEVGSTHVAVQLDTWHMNIEESDTPAAFRRVGPRLGHVHAVESHRGVPGRGQVPWAGVFDALIEVGYEDLIVYEHFPLSLPQMAVRTHTWCDLGSSEEVCVEGTKALRAHLDAARERARQ